MEEPDEPAVSFCHPDPAQPIGQRLAGVLTDKRRAAFAGTQPDIPAGIIIFPFLTVPLCRLVVRGEILALAGAIFGIGDIRIYAPELWAKYSGATS